MSPRNGENAKERGSENGTGGSGKRSRSPSPAADEEDYYIVDHNDGSDQGDDGGDEDPTWGGSTKTRPPKRIKPTILSPEEELDMVEWMKAHPILFNKKLMSNRDKPKKEKLWREKAVEMGRPTLVIKTWYSSLRTRYGRLKRMKRDSEDANLTERDKWIVSHLDFLKPHIHEIQHKRNSTKNQFTFDHSSSADQSLAGACGSSQTAPTPPGLIIKREVSDHEEDSLFVLNPDGQGGQLQVSPRDQLQQMFAARAPVVSTTERDAFMDWVRAVIHDFSPRIWRRCQQEFSQTLFKYIEENDEAKQHVLQ